MGSAPFGRNSKIEGCSLALPFVGGGGDRVAEVFVWAKEPLPRVWPALSLPASETLHKADLSRSCHSCAGVSVRLPSGFLLLQLDRETFVAVRGDCVEHTGERLTVSIARHPAPDRGDAVDAADRRAIMKS